MLASLPESAPAPDPSADKSDIAQTVRQSVMAEQVSHHVVNVPESASGSSSLVDVVANHTSTSAAESGNNHTTPNPNQAPDLSKPQNDPSTEIKPSEDKKVDAGGAAAEPSAGDAAAKPDNVPAIATPSDVSEKGKSDQEATTLNGVHDAASLGSAIEDGGSQDASAVNSDSEISKGETKDGHLHVRANSVKKPTTFSKVSVSKNFLAKSASAAPTTAKTGERASPVSLAAAPVAKPRLIAKTGASIRELQKARQNAESPSGPDASTVWNKNRPTAPPPPKQFTDEELKQQYGIHLATRLQSDENGKESKWADIDEDEDDWVPEAVTWIDGTKSALTPADNVPAPKDVKSGETAAVKPAESAKPILPAPKKEPSGPPKTILKPGAAAQAKQLGTNSQSPGPEKATLKAKSPAPPAKSPWAVLPPVDKSSPITLPTQNVTAPPPFASQDARAYDSSMPPPPAREIAADTFDRSWQHGEGQRRELFNSVSGHYEPAPEGRRSSRPDPYGRKPSVLLRPSGTDHPEPSPAFQTRSGSQTDGAPSWAARRRGSSVSQSGAMAPRRMSINRGSEQFPTHDRRPSAAISHDTRGSPNVGKVEPLQHRFTHQDAWSQQMPAPPSGAQQGTGEELEDPVKVQERIMKEKRELARKRKQEQEDEKEAEKKERLREKMASLANAGESRQARIEREAAEKAAAALALKAASSESSKPADTSDDKATNSKLTENAVESTPTTETPVDTSHAKGAEVATSKVPAPDKIELPSSAAKPEGADMPPRSVSEHLQRQAPRAPLSPKANTRAPFQQAVSSPYRAPNSAFSSPGERKQQPFGRSPMVGNNDGFSPWPSAGSGNVWGTAGIGNGVFESASAFAPMPMMSQQGSSLPPPPGMGRPETTTRISPQGLGSEPRSQNMQPPHGADQARSFGPPGMEGRPDHFMSQARPNVASPGPNMGRQQRIPGPIAPPSRAQPPMQAQHGDDRRLNAWKSAAQTLPAEYANAAKLSNSQDDTPPAPRDDTFKETFKQTTKGRLGGPRKFEKAEYTIHDAQGSRSVTSLPPAPPSTQTQPAVPIPTASPLSHPWKQAAENTVRLPNGSMNPAHGGAHVQQLPIGHPQARPQPAPVGTPRKVKVVAEPLPPNVNSREPPPETAAHPAYAGNAKHPNVRLPRSKPVVKLPPQSAVATSPQPSVVMPPRQHWGPPGAMRPLVQNEAWQARFNGLFGRASITTETPPSPPKTPPKMQGPASEVASSSKTAIGDHSTRLGATVSLPQIQEVTRHTTTEGFTIDDSQDVTSKDTIEQMFNEELSFGSKPMTRVPRNVSYPEASSTSKYNMLDLRPEDLPRPVYSLNKAQYDITQVHWRNNKGCFVKMPGVKTKHNPIFWKKSGPSKGITKPRAKAPFSKENVANPQVSTAPNGGSNPSSRKPSSQKTPSASTVATPQHKSPVPVVPDTAAPVSKRGGFKAPRGRGQAPIKST